MKTFFTDAEIPAHLGGFFCKFCMGTRWGDDGETMGETFEKVSPKPPSKLFNLVGIGERGSFL